MNKSEELREAALKRVLKHLSKNEHPAESDDLEEVKNTSEKIVYASQLHSATSLFHLSR